MSARLHKVNDIPKNKPQKRHTRPIPIFTSGNVNTVGVFPSSVGKVREVTIADFSYTLSTFLFLYRYGTVWEGMKLDDVDSRMRLMLLQNFSAGNSPEMAPPFSPRNSFKVTSTKNPSR